MVIHCCCLTHLFYFNWDGKKRINTHKHGNRWAQTNKAKERFCFQSAFAERARGAHACTLPSYSARTDCWECTRGCTHETGDPPLHTHTYSATHTSTHSLVYVPQVCCCGSLIACVPPVVSAFSPISVLTCSSPSDTHTHTQTHSHTSCSVCCSGCCCYGNPSIVQGDPCTHKTPVPDHVGQECLNLHMLRSCYA